MTIELLKEVLIKDLTKLEEMLDIFQDDYYLEHEAPNKMLNDSIALLNDLITALQQQGD